VTYWKELKRKGTLPDKDTIEGFAWKDRKTTKTLVGIA
jgi:hypothetical protein